MSSSNSSRMAPRSACQACHRLKMKCVREPSISSFSCVRCHKAGRVCSTGPGAATSRKQTGTRVTSKYPAQPTQGESREILKEVHGIHDRNLSSAATETLPSIYSTSPTRHVEEEYRVRNRHGDAGSNQEPNDASTPLDDYISNEDVIQLINMFRERLLPCVSIIQLNSHDFDDASFLIRNHPDLVVCICYVTCIYVPGGYGDVRYNLAKPVKAFVQNVYSRKSRTHEDDLATMQGLCILYAWAGASTTDLKSRDHSSSEINYWAIKSACEGFAIHANFHRASNKLKERTRAGLPLERNDVHTKKYIFWIWLYVKSHLVSRVTRTPLTMHADASIRASSVLLNSISSDPIIEQFLGGLDLCLLWDKLGRKDVRLTEWWCSFDLEEDQDSEESRVTLNDVDLALEEWKSRFSHSFSSDTRTNTNNLNLVYHFYYTKFCLNTHFIRQSPNSLTGGEQAEAIIRCVDSVLNIFNLYHTLGPTRRDQLRYFPDFLFVILSFCASFLIQAIQVFPVLFPHPESDLELVRKLAKLMIGLGDSGHGAFVSGTLILRHLNEMELSTNQQVEISNCQQTVEGLATLADSGICETFTSRSSTAFEVPPDPSLLDFSEFFDPMYQNEWYNFGSPYFT